MPGYSTLIRYALWALLIVACVGFVWHMASTIHDNIYNDGVNSERSKWQAAEAKRLADTQAKIKEAIDKEKLDHESQINALTGALDNANQAKEKLNNDLNAIRATNRGLFIDAKACRSRDNAAQTETEGSGIDGGEPGRIRLPETIERDLWELAADAQRVVIQYVALRDTCLPLVDVAE